MKKDKFYYKDGTVSEGRRHYNKVLHRVDGPAIEGNDGSKLWYINGKLHRTNGPAAEWANGSKEWHINGELHRTDGPAVEWADGSKFWYINGKYHRTDGPAIEWADGSKFWYINGRSVLYWSVERKQFELPHSSDTIDKEHAQLILASVGIIDRLEGYVNAEGGSQRAAEQAKNARKESEDGTYRTCNT